MKIHITGMSPRMVSSRARAKISFSSLLTDTLSVMGHEVVRDAEYHDDADLVVVGVSSMLSPAATYALVALGILNRSIDNGTPVVLFADDPNLGKIRDAAACVRRDPDRLWSDFLVPKRVVASAQYNRDEVMASVDLLGQDTWPTVLVPQHAWGPKGGHSHALRIVSDVVPVDVSPALDHHLSMLPFKRPAHDVQMWLCEQAMTKSEIISGRSTWPVMKTRNSPSWETLDVYGSSRGVFQDSLCGPRAWWTPTPQFAARAGCIYLTDLTESYFMGSPYYRTMDEIEALDRHEQRELADAQSRHLKDISWDLSTLHQTLDSVLGLSARSSRRATT